MEASAAARSFGKAKRVETSARPMSTPLCTVSRRLARCRLRATTNPRTCQPQIDTDGRKYNGGTFSLFLLWSLQPKQMVLASFLDRGSSRTQQNLVLFLARI